MSSLTTTSKGCSLTRFRLNTISDYNELTNKDSKILTLLFFLEDTYIFFRVYLQAFSATILFESKYIVLDFLLLVLLLN